MTKINIDLSRFPSDEPRRKEWIKNVRRKDWMPSEKSLLCSDHFIRDFFTQSDSSKRQLKKEAIPTIFPSYPSYLQISIPKKRRELKRKIVDETKNEELLKLAADLHHVPQNF